MKKGRKEKTKRRNKGRKKGRVKKYWKIFLLPCPLKHPSPKSGQKHWKIRFISVFCCCCPFGDGATTTNNNITTNPKRFGLDPPTQKKNVKTLKGPCGETMTRIPSKQAKNIDFAFLFGLVRGAVGPNFPPNQGKLAATTSPPQFCRILQNLAAKSKSKFSRLGGEFQVSFRIVQYRSSIVQNRSVSFKYRSESFRIVQVSFRIVQYRSSIVQNRSVSFKYHSESFSIVQISFRIVQYRSSIVQNRSVSFKYRSESFRVVLYRSSIVQNRSVSFSHSGQKKSLLERFCQDFSQNPKTVPKT